MAQNFLIADDHSIIRNALKYSILDISEDSQFTETASFSGLLDHVPQGPDAYDLILMDLNMPGYKGLDHIKSIVEQVSPTPIVVFSMMENARDIRAVLDCGIRAYIPKSTENDQIAHILTLVLSGGSYIPPELNHFDKTSQDLNLVGLAGEGAGQGLERLEDQPMWRELTRRQREVLLLMGQGRSNSDISDQLDLTLSTVKTHVTGIFRALQVDNRTQAVLKLKGFKLPGRDY